MNPSKRSLLMAAGVAAAAAAIGAGVAFYRILSGRESEALRRARFLDLSGNTRSLSEWSGHLLLLNFWATWCAPCLEEIPMLVELRHAYAGKSFEVVGIAIDRADKVREMSAKLSIDYPILLSDVRGLQLLRELGNSSGGLPYSLLLARGLSPAGRKLGALKRPEAESMLREAMHG